MSRRIRRSVEPTDDWKQLKLLCWWPEQERYEEIRPLVLFDASVADRAEEAGTSASTLYRRLSRFEEGGMENLFDAPTAKRTKLPPAIRRLILDLKTEYPRFNLNEIAKVVHAALRQMGFDLSRATCRRILAHVRAVYGYGKPVAASGAKKAMPFASSRWHEIWSADVRYLDMPDEGRFGGKVYVVTVMDNYSRAILSSAVTRRQDLSAFLSVLHRAVERYGAPEALVTDSGSVFLANRAKAIYRALSIRKEEIERGKPWQNYLETTFNVQRRMADWYFQRAEGWPELVREHERWVTDYNGQAHFAHERRKDGRRSPWEVLSWVMGMRFHPKDLERAFFSTRFTRKLDASGYATLMRWRLYGEEGLATREADLWLREKTLTVEYAGEPLSSYEVEYDTAGGGSSAGRLWEVSKPTLFETSYASSQSRLFGLAETLGEGWLKMLRLDGYAPRRSRRSEMLQQILFAYTDAI